MGRMQRGTLAWFMAALLGLVVAAGVMAAASHLSSQRVGLASEPPSAGERLAPARTPAAGAPARHRRQAATPPAKAAPPTTAPQTTTDERHEVGQGDGDGDSDD